MAPVFGAVVVDRRAPVFTEMRMDPDPFLPITDRAARIRFGSPRLPGPRHHPAQRPHRAPVGQRLTSAADEVAYRWDGRNGRGNRVWPGLYVVVIKGRDLGFNTTVNRALSVRVPQGPRGPRPLAARYLI